MKVITIDDIRSWIPSYDTGKYLPEDWQGTALDILRMENAPADFRRYVAIREKALDPKIIHLFAAWCVRQAISLANSQDSRIVAACDVAERYATGQASEKELSSANRAAWKAYYEADAAVIRAIDNYSAARAACLVTSNHYSSAISTVSDERVDTVLPIVSRAHDADSTTGWDREFVIDSQVKHLIEMIEGSIKT